MPAVSTLYVIRHAQASMFAADYDVLSDHGRLQAGALGRALAQRYATAGRPGFDAVFTGPALRHRDTAALAKAGFDTHGRSFPAPSVVPGFDEHDGQALVLAAIETLPETQTQTQTWTPHAPQLLDPSLGRLAAEARDPTLDKDRRSRAWQGLYETVMSRWLGGALDALCATQDIETWPQFRDRVTAAFAALRGSAKGEVAVFSSVGPTAVILHEVLAVSPQRAFETAWRLYNTGVTRIVYGRGRVTLDGYNDIGHLPDLDRTHR